jgi:antitoxin component YwqK of YwqJK toxin-antitoxin module
LKSDWTFKNGEFDRLPVAYDKSGVVNKEICFENGKRCGWDDFLRNQTDAVDAIKKARNQNY